MTIKNQVALVTGGGGGLGLAIAEALAAAGAAVAVLDVTQEKADTAVKHLSGLTCGRLAAIEVNVADPDSVASAFLKIDGQFSQIDILVNCAGVREVKTIYDLEPKEWQRVININLCGSFYCAREAALRMRKSGGGSIINITSVAGIMGITHRPAYTASKHGLIGLTKNLACDLAADGIRVNAVAPGTIRTPLTEGYYSDSNFVEGLKEVVPLGAGGDPQDVADAVVYLCSRQAKFITGIVLPVDGGWASSKSYTVGKGASPYTSASNQT